MSAKDQLVFFAEMVFTLILITIAVVYFIVDDGISIFSKIIQALIPVAIILLILIIKLQIDRGQIKKLKEEENFEITLNLNFYSKILSDLILFGTPIVVLLVAVIAKGTLAADDIFQASFVFLIFYGWQKYLFAKS